MANAQVKRTVNVATAGTLSTLISAGDKYTIDELTITGELNGTDLKLVREMVGCDYLGQQTQGKVTKLDLSGIRIVAGGEKYLDTKEIYNSGGACTSNGSGFVFSSENDVLGSYLFAGCDKLEEIKLPNSIKAIGDNVFHFGYGLTSLTIPKNVTSIGRAVIIFCENIVSLSVEEGNTVFSSPNGSNAVIKGNTLIMGCNTTVIPNTITTIGNSAFYGIGKWGSKMALPSTVTTIENDAFACCNFTEVEMPEGLRTIGEYAFAWTPITNFQIPASVTSIGYRVLYGCQNVESIVVNTQNANYDSRDNSNAIIDKTSNTVIQGCKNTVIPQSVKAIGNSAFEQLNNLESFTIPSWITSIGDRAFADCWNMKDITSEIEDPSAVTMGWDVFSNYNQNMQRTLYVPSGTKDAYEAISVWKKDFYEIVEKEPEKKEVTLHVATAGTLPSLISNNEKYDITDLTLTGELNGSDFRLLRDMAGNDYQGNLTNGKLSKLDLSGATIVSGGDYYINTTTIHWTDNMQMVMVNPMQFNTNNNELGSYLFAGCKSLVTIILPRNITAIRSDVFSHNSKLLSLEIPKTVSSISIGFIQECEKMSSLSVESGNQTYSSPEGSNAIIRTANMELVAGCKNTIIPSGTKTIDAYAFQHCISLISIKIPESITTIGDFAFWGCSGLTELIIPASVTQIGNMAFYGCSALNSIIVDSENSVYDSRNNCNALIETSSNTLLLGCKNTIIPNGILNIGENAFRPCDGLTSIEIPASVISIGDNAFAYCYQLKRVISNIADPNTVVMGSTVFDRISGNAILKVPQGTKASYMAADGWKDAFSNIVEMGDQDPNTIDVAVAGTLSSLLVNPMEIEELTLTGDLNGTDLRLIREMAGNDYLGQPTNGVLKKLDISGANIVEGGEKYLDADQVWSSHRSYTQWGGEYFHFNTQQNVLGNAMFAGCEKLIDIVLPKSITSIGDLAFWDCMNLESLVIPENVSSIGMDVFIECNKLSNVSVAEGNMTLSAPANCNVLMEGTTLRYAFANPVIPKGTTVIGSRAFERYNGNADFVVPEGVVSIGNNAFAWSNIKSISLPSTLKRIDHWAFSLTQLESITIPASVEFIGERIMNHCSNLTTITVASDNPLFDSRDHCNAIIETATNTLIQGCKTTIIPESVTALGTTAFTECQDLTNITIPKSITHIGDCAFMFCARLKDVYSLIEEPFAISQYAFPQIGEYYGLTTTFHVPYGTKEAYLKADGWKEFKDYIVEVVMTDDVAYTLNEEEKTITVEGSDQTAKEIEILPAVEIEGEKYEVTAIGESAFENNESLEKLTIPETIESIGDNAFAGCKNLNQIRVFADEPIKLGNTSAGTRGSGATSVFAEVDMETCVLYVPAGSKEKYEQADGWKDFKHIVEMGETAPITIGKSGKASYCGDKSLDFSFSDKIKAYIATGFDKDEGTIWLTRVKDVPAGVPVLIKGEAEKTYQVPVTDSQNSYYTNMFVGNTSGADIQLQEKSDDGNKVNYYLKDGTFLSVSGNAKIGNNKCYLQLPATFNASVTGASQTVTIKESGKASFAAPVDLDFTNVDGLKAFTATGYDKSTKTIWLTRVMKVQRGEGVLLKGDPDNYEIPSVAAQSHYENMFVGNTSGATIEIYETSYDGSQTNYYLKDGTFLSVTGNAKIGNNKCYLALPTSMVATGASTRGSEKSYKFEEPEMIKLPISFRSLENDGDGTTGIKVQSSMSHVQSDAYYTLQGQRVVNPGKGLYIKNGKKVVIK